MFLPIGSSKDFRPFTHPRPMTRARYERLVLKLRANHPWTKDCLLSPAPGHLIATVQFLRQVERVVPLEDLADGVFLSITTACNALAINLELRMVSKERSETLVALKTSCVLTAKNSCVVCGIEREPDDAIRLWDGRCSTHHKRPGIFAEELRRNHKKGAVQLEPKKTSAQPDQPQNSVETQDESLAGRTPYVMFLDAAELLRFEQGLYRRPKDQEARLKPIIEQIHKLGCARRKLRTLPKNWLQLVDEFERDFPNFAEFADLLKDHFSLSALGDRSIQIPATLFVGPPGIGKTEALRWISRRFELPFTLIDMACAQSGAALAGSESFWGNSQPGQLFNLLASQPNANPMVMLDELDKAGGDERFDPLAALHTLLEPAAARNFVDLSVRDLAINASHVNWLATANDLERLSKPILSRFSVLHIPAPSAEHVSIIVRNLYHQIRDDSSWGQHFAGTLCDEVVERMLTLAPRKIRITLQRAFGAAARAGRSYILVEDLKSPSLEKPKIFGFIASP